MCRISPVGDDWVVKGCHLHVGRIEVVLRPDHKGGIVCRKVFSSTTDREIDLASGEVTEWLKDPVVRARLTNRIERAMEYLLGVVGELNVTARGRLREFRMILVALERWE